MNLSKLYENCELNPWNYWWSAWSLLANVNIFLFDALRGMSV